MTWEGRLMHCNSPSFCSKWLKTKEKNNSEDGFYRSVKLLFFKSLFKLLIYGPSRSKFSFRFHDIKLF
ncbi:hypothetical protein GDO81_007859 [Engystomops pustulosus]|uniref:Uncharacterized protein n=1 Tax=Engystomops pustulosus TaxID=76066 RepID=A0AAV7CAK9_ENGPU|nr:hypothetical protein GDO81_007859 [Engystomops pustulosus]